MSTDITAGIVRILAPDGNTAGTGFVATNDGLIATCAHVVGAAGAGPGHTVRVVFYATSDEREAKVEPGWRRDFSAEDVAILRLEGRLPEDVASLQLGSSRGCRGHEFEAFGYPRVGPYEESHARGTILGHLQHPDGWQMLEFSSEQIAPGMSGAPVFDTVTRCVIGMVNAFPVWKDGEQMVAGVPFRRHTETNFAIPTEVLRLVCPVLQVSDICPYRGLAAFTEADAEFFFGRDTLAADLVGHLRSNSRFLAVVGPSGSGKSSVVQAGLFPALHRGEVPGSEAWHLLSFRPGADPFAALTTAGLDVSQESDLPAAICAFLEACPQVKRLVLFADQFEELFTLCLQPVQEQFLGQLADLLEGNLSVTVVLTLRADFYGHLLCYRPLADWLEVSQVNVLPMGPEELRAAVEEPRTRLGFRFEPGLIETIVDEAGAADHPLPLLESALTQLWEKREDGNLTHAAYQAVGRVAGAIGQWAEDAYRELALDERRLAQRIFTRLVRYGEGEAADTGQRQSLSELVTRPEEQEPLHRVVRQLADARLLVTGGDPGAETVEIIHDALLQQWDRLKHWTAEQREFYLWRQRLDERLEEWKGKGQDEGALLRGALLAEAERWRAERSEGLNPGERRYIRKSVGLQEREQAAGEWLRRRIILGLAGGLLVALVLAVTAGLGWQSSATSERSLATEAALHATARADAETAAAAEALARQSAEVAATTEAEAHQIAFSRQLAAQALTHLEAQLDLALLLSVEAYQIANTFEARSSLLTGLEHSPFLASFLRGHTDSVTSVAFSPDGKTLASSGSDGIILWDVATRQPLGQPLTGHIDNVNSVAFSPDGRILASGSADGIILWDVVTRQPAGQPLTGPTGPVTSITFSPDGKILASSSCGYLAFGAICDEAEIRLWDVATRQLLGQPLTCHTYSVGNVAFSPDGKTLALGCCAMDSPLRYSFDCTKGEIRLWDVATRQLLGQPLTGHIDNVNSVAFSPDGRILASGSADGIILWDVVARQPAGQSLTGYISWVNSMAFSPDGKTLASSSADGIILWDVATRQPLGQPLPGHTGLMHDLAFSPDGQMLVSGGQDGTMVLWDLSESLRVPYTFWADRWELSRNLFSEDFVTRQPLGQPLIGYDSYVYSMAFSPDGKMLASSGSDGIILWDVATRQPLGQPLIGYGMAFSPDGKMLASSGSDGIILWDIATRQPLSPPLVGHTGEVTGLAFSPDGKMLASSGSDGIILWDIATRQPLSPPLVGHTGEVPGLAFSPDGKMLASSSSDGIILWDVATREHLGQPLIGYDSYVYSMAFSPDGKMLASSHYGDIILWNINARQPISRSLTSPTGPVTSVAFSPDGKTLASGHYNNTIILWDVVTGQPAGQPLTGPTGPVTSVAFSPDGKTLASGSCRKIEAIFWLYGEIFLWDVTARQPLSPPLVGHTGAVTGLAFSPDGKTLASRSSRFDLLGGEQNTLILWDTDLESWQARACSIANRNLSREEWRRYIGEGEPYRPTCSNIPAPEK